MQIKADVTRVKVAERIEESGAGVKKGRQAIASDLRQSQGDANPT